jgi:hypothetical protein
MHRRLHLSEVKLSLGLTVFRSVDLVRLVPSVLQEGIICIIRNSTFISFRDSMENT